MVVYRGGEYPRAACFRIKVDVLLLSQTILITSDGSKVCLPIVALSSSSCQSDGKVEPEDAASDFRPADKHCHRQLPRKLS